MNKEKITNPLTIVGIFAGIAEVAGTTVLAFLSVDLQKIFIWFVMGFPIVLVILFFLTWNFNPTVLYAPSDYKDEKLFADILSKKYKAQINDNYKEIENLVESIKKDKTIEQTAKGKILEIENKLNETKKIMQKLVYKFEVSEGIIELLSEGMLTLDQIASNFDVSKSYTLHYLNFLIKRDKIKIVKEGNEIYFALKM